MASEELCNWEEGACPLNHMPYAHLRRSRYDASLLARVYEARELPQSVKRHIEQCHLYAVGRARVDDPDTGEKQATRVFYVTDSSSAAQVSDICGDACPLQFIPKFAENIIVSGQGLCNLYKKADLADAVQAHIRSSHEFVENWRYQKKGTDRRLWLIRCIVPLHDWDEE